MLAAQRSVRPAAAACVAFAIVLLLPASGCTSDPPSAPLLRGTTVEIADAPDEGVIFKDGTHRLRAIVRSDDGVEIPRFRVSWRSSDNGRATVAADGLVTGVELGDVDVTANAGGATATTALSVRLAVPVPRGSDGPITTTLLGGDVRVTVPARAVSAGTLLHLRPAVEVPESSRLLRASAIELGPESARFDSPITLSLAIPADVPAIERPLLRIHRADDGDWNTLSGNAVDLSERRVRAAITRGGTYAILRRRPPSSMEATDGDDQHAGAGTAVPIAPRVLVRDAENQPVEGVVVRFTVVAGGGVIVGPDSGISTSGGTTSLPGEWRLGPLTGLNLLFAALPGYDVPTVTFTAVATLGSVEPTSRSLRFSDEEINFDGPPGGPSPPPRSVQVSAVGATVSGLSVGTITYIPDVPGWLQATLDRAATPAVLTLTPDFGSLIARDYLARVPVLSTMPGVRPETLSVRLGVRGGGSRGRRP
ncbi:MAG: Ig-like domain-containing protein [Gemmatimonadaceae bacterium]